MIVYFITKPKMKHYIFTIILFAICLVVITFLCMRVKLLEDCVLIQQVNIHKIVQAMLIQSETNLQYY